MRTFFAVAAAALVGMVSANQPQYNNQRPPSGPPYCPDFFSTTVTTNVSNPTFGPMTDSIHYQLTVKKINYGRNTYIQHRFYSNFQDMPLRDVTMCMVADIWSFNISNLSQNPADAEPEYKGRARFKPSIKGGQPVVQGPLTTTNKYLSNPTNKKVYCVTIPYVKPKGRQFVDLLYYTEPCLYGTTFRGWVELPNPYNSSILCRSNITTSSSKASTTKYSIRSIVSTNKKMSRSCPNYPW